MKYATITIGIIKLITFDKKVFTKLIYTYYYIVQMEEFMAWCPKCRNEYIAGIAICKDCNEQLVNSLEEYDKARLEEELNEEMNNQQLELSDEILDSDETDNNTSNKDNLLSQSSHAYVKKEDKYKDMLSSAYTLLLVGFGGLVFLLLVVTDIINLNLASPGKYVTYSGVAILLVVFIIIGFYSLRSSTKLAKEADSENQLTNDIIEWFNKNITSDLIENEITDDLGDEMKYFKRIDNIKLIISKAYGELNEDYLDKLSEDIYHDKFEKEL